MFNLKNKKILLTGATGFIGRALALGLSQFGATIYINSRSETDCNHLTNELLDKGFNAISTPFDVTDEDTVKTFCESSLDVDILINNSYAGTGGTMLTSCSSDYIMSYKSSVVASANLIKLLTPKLLSAVKTNNDAAIVNIASMYGSVSPNLELYSDSSHSNPPFYGAAKAGLIQLTKYAACELAPMKIRVNSVSPGPFPSESAQVRFPTMVRKIEEKVPLRRIGTPDELIGPVSFLASDASTYITGINLPVDGGWTAW